MKNQPSSIRLFLDLPFRYGLENIKLGFSSSKPILTIAHDTVKMEYAAAKPQIKALSLKNRISYVALGVAECIPVIGIIVACAERYFTPKPPRHLIRSDLPIATHQYHWFLNLALLRSAYDQANGAEKKQIEFLAANFLNKVTPKSLNRWIKTLKSYDSSYTTRHIGSPIDEYSYHRENIDHDFIYGEKYNKNLAYQNDSLFVLTDTIDLKHIMSLGFDILDKDQSNQDYQNFIYRSLSEHFDAFENGSLENNLKKPFILDLTDHLEASIHTNQNPEKESAFKKCLSRFSQEFETIQSNAIAQLIKDRPELADKKRDIFNFVQKNTSCIYRVQTKEYSALKILPFGCYKTRSEQKKSPLLGFKKNTGWWLNFITSTGTYINAIDLRKIISNVFEQRPDVKYMLDENLTRAQMQALYYPDKDSFIQSRLFQRLSYLFGSSPLLDETDPASYGISRAQLSDNIEYMETKPHLMTMGKLTIDLVQGLLQEITEEKWQEIHQNPVFAQILQTSLFMMHQHLAQAELKAFENNFDEFMQKIELAHAELATLLELTHPFSKEDFNTIFKKELLGKSIPQAHADHVQCGIGKSATNVFSGALAAALKKDGYLESVVGTNSYYEQGVMTQHNFDAFLNNPTAPKANLYHAQIFPNVNIGANPIEYQKKDIASDVRALIKNNKTAEDFTVAIDLTIDNFYSDSVADLISSFQEEIDAGHLNFVFFASGQKFYNLGMDHYYGSPFYIVNNRHEKWDTFNDMLTHPAHTPDMLSTQWFNLVTKYAPDGLDNYRSLIFKNTQDILERIPASLKHDPQKKQKIRMNTASKNSKVPFLDLKVLAPMDSQERESLALKQKFYKMMQEEHMEACTRGSFGFFHCNFAIFGPLDDHARTVRINPGINPEEVDKILKFLNDIAPAQ
jgi:hypothetical protein